MSLRSVVIAVHRDLGYFFAGVVIIYAVSGIAMNHVNDWNPNFVIERRDVPFDIPPTPELVTRESILAALGPLGEAGAYRSFDFPTSHRFKVYLKDGSVCGTLGSGRGEYEIIRRRPLLFEANALHLHPGGWWLWFADIFAVALIVITGTGLFVLRGRRGISGRGKWLIAAGIVLPIAALFAV